MISIPKYDITNPILKEAVTFTTTITVDTEVGSTSVTINSKNSNIIATTDVESSITFLITNIDSRGTISENITIIKNYKIILL